MHWCQRFTALTCLDFFSAASDTLALYGENTALNERQPLPASHARTQLYTGGR